MNLQNLRMLKVALRYVKLLTPTTTTGQQLEEEE
jgi:hypothetical protein